MLNKVVTLINHITQLLLIFLVMQRLNMELGKFIDDIRKEIKWFNVNFETDPFGEQMTITFPPKTRSYIISRWHLGEIKYGSPRYNELLELTLYHLRTMSENVA